MCKKALSLDADRSALVLVRQGHGEREDFLVAVMLDMDVDRIGVDVDVFADDGEQFALEQRQVVGRRVGTTLLRDNDQQPFLCELRRVFRL